MSGAASATDQIFNGLITFDSNFLESDLEEGYIDETYEALTTLQFLLNKHKVSQKVYFDAEYIKIDLL